MFNDHLSSYRLPARWLVRTQLPAGSQSVRVKCPNMTLSDPTPVFLEPVPFTLCKGSARPRDSFGSKDKLGNTALHAGENRDFLSPGPSAPVDGKEGASC